MSRIPILLAAVAAFPVMWGVAWWMECQRWNVDPDSEWAMLPLSGHPVETAEAA